MSDQREYTGSSVSYYAIDVNDPINEESDPYTAECQDIIEALKLDFNEGNVLKAIWRRAAARLGRSKKGYDDGLYDAEKIVFYGQRLVAIEQRARRSILSPILPKPTEAQLRAVSELSKAALELAEETDPYGPRDAEGWYAWNGDETMRPAGKVDYIMRGWPSEGDSDTGTAEGLRWEHNGSNGDIVKWRPAQ
jgi:hypothetical protein